MTRRARAAPAEVPGDRQARAQSLTIERVPKPGGGHRVLVRLGGSDGRRYAAAVLAAMPAVERALRPTVFANRAGYGRTGRTILEPWTAARARYVRAVRAAGEGGERAWFVGDVADCFGSIGPPVVGRALRSMGVDPGLARGIEDLLHSFEDHGVRGLPIGPAPSAVLANAVLASVDDALARAAGSPALRWVDDVVVPVAGVARARAVAEAYERSLGALDLRPHPLKTEVLEHHRPVPGAGSGLPAAPGSSVA